MRGFTLLELCLVIAIAGILAVLGVASFSQMCLFQKTAYMTQALTETMDFARQQAVLRYQIVDIYPANHNWQNGWLIQLAVNQKILRDYPVMPLKIVFSGFQTKTPKIRIFPDGTAEGYQGHFDYGGKKLFINRGGRIRIEN